MGRTVVTSYVQGLRATVLVLVGGMGMTLFRDPCLRRSDVDSAGAFLGVLLTS